MDTFLLITNHKSSSNASNAFPSSSDSGFEKSPGSPSGSHSESESSSLPGFSRKNNQALLERESINSGFHVTGEIRSEDIYLQMDPKMEDRLSQV